MLCSHADFSEIWPTYNPPGYFGYWLSLLLRGMAVIGPFTQRIWRTHCCILDSTRHSCFVSSRFRGWWIWHAAFTLVPTCAVWRSSSEQLDGVHLSLWSSLTRHEMQQLLVKDESTSCSQQGTLKLSGLGSASVFGSEDVRVDILKVVTTWKNNVGFENSTYFL